MSVAQNNNMPGTTSLEVSRLSQVFLVIFGLLGLAVGFDLFFFSEQTDVMFAWTINPALSAALLGAGYLSSILIAPMALREKYWARSQPSFVGFLPGLAFILLATVLHIDRFHLNSPQLFARLVAWGWVIGYAVVTLAMIAMLALQMRQTVAKPPTAPLPGWLKTLFVLVALSAVSVSATLVIAPTVLIPMWPWQLTPLVARMLGAFLAAQGSSALLALFANDSHKVKIMCTGYILFVSLQIVALLRFNSQFTLASLGGITYALILGLILLTGIAGVMQARRVAD